MKKIIVNGITCRVERYGGPKTARYHECLKILEENSIVQIPVREAISFVLHYEKVPEEERKSIREFLAYPEDRILVIRCSKNQELFKARIPIATKIGWYPYITGVDLPRSSISDFVDQFVHRRRSLNIKKSTRGPIILVPVSISPNYQSFLLKLGDVNILLDAGIKMGDIDMVDPKEIDMIFISHAHFDHTSALLPLYLAGCKAPIIATATTIDFLMITLGTRKTKTLLKYLLPARYGERLKIDENDNMMLINAGHIPGSAMALITTSGSRILYTGDFCLRDHFPVKGSADEVNLMGKVDAIIMNCSFADTRFKPDSVFYDSLCKECEFALLAKKNVLIAADPEVMSQNVFLSLHEYFSNPKKTKLLKPPVYIEQKAIEYMKAVRTRLEDLPREFQSRIQKRRDPFASVMRKTMFRNSDRDEALGKPSIILSGPSYDLSTFPIIYFLSQIANDEKNLLVLTGFGGRMVAEQLAKEKRVRSTDKTIVIKSKIFNHQYPNNILAFHCDYRQLEFTLARLRPEKIIPFHAATTSLGNALMLSKKYQAEFNLPRKKTKIYLK
jgi:Cft2 family RNA processing exonuclease